MVAIIEGFHCNMQIFGDPNITASITTQQVTVKSPGHPLLSKVVDEGLGTIIVGVLSGEAQCTAEAVMKVPHLKEAVNVCMCEILTTECSRLCQVGSLFRNLSLTALAGKNWIDYIHELNEKAPTLLSFIFTLVSVNDSRNVKKVGEAHYPGVCAAVAVLLKERCKDVDGIQSLVSLMMYDCHCEKQACHSNTFYNGTYKRNTTSIYPPSPTHTMTDITC